MRTAVPPRFPSARPRSAAVRPQRLFYSRYTPTTPAGSRCDCHSTRNRLTRRRGNGLCESILGRRQGVAGVQLLAIHGLPQTLAVDATALALEPDPKEAARSHTAFPSRRCGIGSIVAR